MGKYKTKLPPPKPKKRFPVWIILTGVGFLVLAIWLFQANANRAKANIEVTGAPKVKVDQELINYGDVQLGGSPIRTVVRVTNVGDQVLKFNEAPYIEVLEGC